MYNEILPKKDTLLSHQLKEALVDCNIDVFYQPKIETRTGKIIGFEALARWNHPTLGLIPPEVFIRVAEQTGMIKILTFCVLDKVVAQHQSWIAAGVSFPVSINISALVFLEPLFVEEFIDYFKRNQLSPNCFDLELTESAFVAFPEKLNYSIQIIRSFGFRIYIDDFGVGFSSFSRLSSLPVDGLKIDKSFLRDIHQHRNAVVVMESIVKIAKKLNLESVMEGVETENDLIFLQTIGCNSAQGYLIGIPMSSSASLDWLFSRRDFTWKNINII